MPIRQQDRNARESVDTSLAIGSLMSGSRERSVPNEAESAEPEIAPPPYQRIREVRLAVVMYGGVSLAIYMNGIAQELYHLVRSTAPRPQEPHAPDRVGTHTSVGQGTQAP